MRNRQLTRQPRTIVPTQVEYVDEYPLPADYPQMHPQYPPPSYPQRSYPAPMPYDYPPPVPGYDVHMQTPRQTHSKAVLGGVAAGWFLGAWMLAVVSPAITLSMWFLGIGYLVYRALK